MNNDYENIEIPSKTGGYMKFSQPESVFRILSKPITGWLGWKTQPDGSRKPVRKHADESIAMNEIDDEENVKFFWSMVVWDYQTEAVEILEITQKSIQKAIKAIASDKDWGSPLLYDLKVSKTGEKLETRYTVQPKPAKPLDKAIEQLYQDMQINLDALYDGADPFSKEEIDLDKVQDFEGTDPLRK